jgi:hypothetical protein
VCVSVHVYVCAWVYMCVCVSKKYMCRCVLLERNVCGCEGVLLERNVCIALGIFKKPQKLGFYGNVCERMRVYLMCARVCVCVCVCV